MRSIQTPPNVVSYSLLLKRAYSEAVVGEMTGSRLLTCCQFAIAVSNEDALRDLLPHVDHIDLPLRGETLLMTAAKLGNLKAANILIEFGADAGYQTLAGNTAADIAEMHGNQEVADFIRAYDPTHEGPGSNFNSPVRSHGRMAGR